MHRIKFHISCCRHCEEKQVKWNKEKINEWLAEHGNGTILISEYTRNIYSNLEFKCGCNRTFTRSWGNMKNRQRYTCNVCSNHIIWDKESINEYLSNLGIKTRLESE